MTALREEQGVMALTTVVLLPLVLVVLLGVLQLGAVRVVAERARIAADLATVTAVNDQDRDQLARTGRLRTAPGAVSVARESFADNIAPLQASLAATPDEIAATAIVSAFDPGAMDPATGRTYTAATVRLIAALPVMTPLFAALLAQRVTVVQISSSSSAR